MNPLVSSSAQSVPFVRFGAKRVDDGRLPILYKRGELSGMVPAQLWRLQARDYPRLAQMLNWWGHHGSADIFETDDLGPRIKDLKENPGLRRLLMWCAAHSKSVKREKKNISHLPVFGVPVMGPVLLRLKAINDELMNHLKPHRFDEGRFDEDLLEDNPLLDISGIRDYALTVDGKTLALARMSEQNTASRRYYEKLYPGLGFDREGSVYEVELLEAAFWNRSREGGLFEGTLKDITQTMLLNMLDQLPPDAEVVYTPASHFVNRLFVGLLKANGIPYEEFHHKNMYGRTRFTDYDYESCYPVFYKFRAVDFKPQVEALKKSFSGTPFSPEAMVEVSRQLAGVEEPVKLVPRARFKRQG